MGVATETEGGQRPAGPEARPAVGDFYPQKLVEPNPAVASGGRGRRDAATFVLEEGTTGSSDTPLRKGALGRLRPAVRGQQARRKQ